jgi:hypothetical protein
VTINSDRLSTESPIPRHILSRIKDCSSFERNLACYTTMDNDDLLHPTMERVSEKMRIQ